MRTRGERAHVEPDLRDQSDRDLSSDLGNCPDEFKHGLVVRDADIDFPVDQINLLLKEIDVCEASALRRGRGGRPGTCP